MGGELADAFELRDGPPLQSPAQYHRLARALTHDGTAPRSRIAVLSTFTVEFVKPFLLVELARLGIHAELFFGGFGQIESLISDEQSALHAFAPDIVVIASRVEDLSPDAVLRVGSLDASDLDRSLDDSIDRVRQLLATIPVGRRWRLLVSNFSMPAYSVLGVGDAALGQSRASAFARANERLRDLLSGVASAHVWDYAGLVHTHGASRWTDSRLWYMARIPVAAPFHGELGQHLARTVRAALFPPAKVLVVDLDNTIWGGAIGDDGVGGIQLGDDWPGNSFKALQRRLRGLRDRGILLVIASKNEQSVVEEAFRVHPEMVLQWTDFAAARITWSPKSQSIREMSEELMLGIDAFVLLDDNPVECAEVLAAIPQMRVVNVEAWGSIDLALAQTPWFDQLSTTAEDLQRTELYARERQRRDLSAKHTSVKDFLASLEMVGQVGRTSTIDRARVAQLFAKTNQFNLTARRFAEASLAQWSEAPDAHCVASIRIRDRFGDQGLVAAAVMHRDGKQARIDNFIMSCRVMNRRVEFGLLAFLADIARDWGCVTLGAEFIKSPKNSAAADFLSRAGLVLADGGVASTAQFTVPMAPEVLPWPTCIRRESSS